MRCVFVLVLLLQLLQTEQSSTGQTCAFCSGMDDQKSCNSHVECADYEECYVRYYETASGQNLYDLGCMTSTECPHTISAIIGKRGEGHHVRCEACCNNATLCNKDLSCQAIHNQGPTFPRDCSELVLQERLNESYTIYPYDVRHKPVGVYCIFDYQDVAWTVFQRRFDGSVDFYRDWGEYTRGFGETSGEYWLGLEHIHALTSIPNYELKVVMSDFENVTKHARYTSFHVEDATRNYRLTVFGYSGTAGDALTSENGMMFSTYDNDHDSSSANCASYYHGAWWYGACYTSNLNGEYLGGYHSSAHSGIEWETWHGTNYSRKSTVMMIRKT